MAVIVRKENSTVDLLKSKLLASRMMSLVDEGSASGLELTWPGSGNTPNSYGSVTHDKVRRHGWTNQNVPFLLCVARERRTRNRLLCSVEREKGRCGVWASYLLPKHKSHQCLLPKQKSQQCNQQSFIPKFSKKRGVEFELHSGVGLWSKVIWKP